MEKFSKFVNESKFTRFDDAQTSNQMLQNMHDFVTGIYDMTEGLEGKDGFTDKIEALVNGISWFCDDFADGDDSDDGDDMDPKRLQAIRALVKGFDSLKPLFKKCKQVEAFNIMA